MVNKKWVRLPWFGLTSTRYFYTVLPNQQRIIVDYGSGFPNLLGLPYINRKKKYDIYLIPDDEDISSLDKYLVSEYSMVWRSVKISGGTLLAKVFGGGVLATVVLVGFQLFGNPILELSRIIHVSPGVFPILLGFGCWLSVKLIAKHNMKKRLDIDKFPLKAKAIQIRLKDWLSKIASICLTVFAIFFLMLFWNDHEGTSITIITILIWFAFLSNTTIMKTSDLYINKNNLEEITKDK